MTKRYNYTPKTHFVSGFLLPTRCVFFIFSFFAEKRHPHPYLIGDRTRKRYSGLAPAHIVLQNEGRNDMAKEKAELGDKKNEICISVFKNEILTKEDYTNRWIELITVLERKKCVNLSPSP